MKETKTTLKMSQSQFFLDISDEITSQVQAVLMSPDRRQDDGLQTLFELVPKALLC